MEDEQLAQAAQSLDNTGSWYFVGAQDCRSAQVRLQEQIYGTVGIGRFFDRIVTAVIDAVHESFQYLEYLADF